MTKAQKIIFAAGALLAGLFLVLDRTGLLARLSVDGQLSPESAKAVGVGKILILAAGLGLMALAVAMLLFGKRILSDMEHYQAYLSGLDARRAGVWLFAFSFLGLFFEVLILRWATVEIRLFAYMKNFPLMSCFLGLGLGYALARRRLSLYPVFPMAFSLFCGAIFALSITGLANYIPFPGAGERIWSAYQFINRAFLEDVVFFGFLAFLFIGNTLCFVPLGQAAGTLMARLAPIPAYTINIAGSLLGTAAFTVIACFNVQPVVWFAGGLAVAAAFLFPRKLSFAAAVLFAGAFLALLLLRGGGSLWSPYYKIDVTKLTVRAASGEPVPQGYSLQVNQDYHQTALDLSDGFLARYEAVSPRTRILREAYDLPYWFTRPRAVLVVGAGMGNDVAAALRNGADRVTAVEIDPMIIRLGRKLHPEQPYADSRVAVVNADAREFMQNSHATYDLIVFGLLDSHTLFSHYSNLRLDNYIYTVESLALARRMLRPGGLVALSYSTGGRQTWISGRLYRMMTQVFGKPPLAAETNYDQGVLFVAGEAFDARAAAAGLAQAVTPDPGAPGAALSARDDWPFLYLKHREISGAYWSALALILTVSLLLIRPVFPGMKRFDLHFFFLGAAFLLIEFRSITEMALLFGSTWVVNTIVIGIVLVMILVANLIAARTRRFNIPLLYLLLFVSIGVGYAVPLSALLLENLLLRGMLSGAVMMLPVLFAGMIFASSIKGMKRLDDAFGPNLIGAVFGGLTEYATLVYGLKSVYLIALVLYACSMLALYLTRREAAA